MLDGEVKPCRQRIIRVSREVLARALHLPEGTEIVDVTGQFYFGTGDIALKVEHPDFTPVYGSEAIPEIRPLLGEQRVVKFMGWQE